MCLQGKCLRWQSGTVVMRRTTRARRRKTRTRRPRMRKRSKGGGGGLREKVIMAGAIAITIATDIVAIRRRTRPARSGPATVVVITARQGKNEQQQTRSTGVVRRFCKRQSRAHEQSQSISISVCNNGMRLKQSYVKYKAFQASGPRCLVNRRIFLARASTTRSIQQSVQQRLMGWNVGTSTQSPAASLGPSAVKELAARRRVRLWPRGR